MSAAPRTTEEFLTARGWAPRPGGWDPPHRPAAGPTYDIYPTAIPTAKALEIQLREERRINEFLLTQDVSAWLQEQEKAR